MNEFNMNEHLKGKYSTSRPVMGFPAKPRTGNSHGPAKSKLPAHVPCKRAPAGPGSFKADLRPIRLMEMHVDSLTGRKTMHEFGTAQQTRTKSEAFEAIERLDR